MKLFTKYYLAIFSVLSLLLFSVLEVKGQDANRIQVHNMALGEGLSQVTITSIVEDDKGFMWFATQDGLNRYDGNGFKVYKSELGNENTLTDNYVNDLCKDGEGNLWIGTSNGLTFFDPAVEKFIRYQKNPDKSASLSNNSINDVYCSPGGSIWISTSDGLTQFKPDEGEFSIYNLKDNSNNFESTYRDHSGTLWASSPGQGIFILDEEKKELVPFHVEGSRGDNLEGLRVNDIMEDEAGHLWLGTESGILRLNKQRTEYIYFTSNTGNSGGLSHSNVRTMLQDAEGNIWAGTEKGLNRYQPEEQKFVQIRSQNNGEDWLSNRRIYSLYEDSQNILWIGTWTRGIGKFSYYQQKFEHYTSKPDKNSIADDTIWGFAEDSNQHIWIATNNGLDKFNPTTKRFHHFSHDPDNTNSIPDDIVTDVEIDERGNIWASTLKGLAKYDPEKDQFTRYQHEPDNPNSLGANFIWSIHVDDRDRIWTALNGEGVNVFNQDTETFTRYDYHPDEPGGLMDPHVADIHQDTLGQVWIGTQKGLNVLNEKTGKFYSFPLDSANPHSLTGNYAYEIYEDSQHRIWVGTAQGLNMIDPETREVKRYYTKRDGLPHSTIWSIIEDNQGRLFLGTSFGLSVFDPEQETFKNYDQRDGVQANEFSAGAVLRSSEGQIYMGGVNGYNVINPSDLQDNPYIPPVVLTDFQLFNKDVPISRDNEEGILHKSISYTDKLVLSYKENVFSFEFAALNYLIPEKNRYAYKMEGFEEDWNYVGSRNFATYTDLPPGEYTFRVKASNNDGVWNEEGTSLALVVTPPFWQTTWFYLLMGLFIVGAVIGGYRYRVRRITARNKLLERKVNNRTAELDEKNTELAEKNEHLEKVLHELKETRNELVEKAHKAGMADIASGVLHNVGNILNSVNTSASLIQNTVQQSKLEGLIRANEILRDHVDDLEHFVAEHPKGKELIRYYLKLEEPLKEEQQNMLKQSKRLLKKIELINDAISAQQSYVGTSMEADETSLAEMIDNALALQAGSIEKHGLTIEKNLEPTDAIMTQRSKLIHVLVNIFKNAKEAMSGMPPEQKKITIETWQDADGVYLSISDNGVGIRQEHLDKIFTQGFTTKESGHGFGLHSSANYMSEMGGELAVESEGEGKGTTFILTFPRLPQASPTVHQSENK